MDTILAQGGLKKNPKIGQFPLEQLKPTNRAKRGLVEGTWGRGGRQSINVTEKKSKQGFQDQLRVQKLHITHTGPAQGAASQRAPLACTTDTITTTTMASFSDHGPGVSSHTQRQDARAANTPRVLAPATTSHMPVPGIKSPLGLLTPALSLAGAGDGSLPVMQQTLDFESGQGVAEDTWVGEPAGGSSLDLLVSQSLKEIT